MQRSHRKEIARAEGAYKNARVGVIVAEFNADITEKLLRGTLRELRVNGVPTKSITVRHVPGSFEIPLACQKLAETGEYDALVALGSVIKGETDHYYYIAGEAVRGIMEVMLKFSIPIGFGVLTANTLAQAKARAGSTIDAGGAAARAALSMVELLH